ncbi:MAG: biopolymer transporter ExbD [Puniceicoccales bacterium]|jgi:biopolymer transport protein ExbD|nr:biopolymer transporter ExbD [Puniceicoccales bacterium]
MRQQENKSAGDLGFQIAPMIDVVFVIMLFFMVMAGAVKVEFELKIKLPGDPTESAEAMDIPDELTISITKEGQVAINDSEVDRPNSKTLPQLYAEVRLLGQNASQGKNKLLVTVKADEQATYDRIALVLDTLAEAGANENVTFDIGDPDEG